MFDVGSAYTKQEIYAAVGVPEERRGGPWLTGYAASDAGAFFIFCNVGGAGRTGHDYPNAWQEGRLEWSAKTGTKIQHDQIQQLIAPRTDVHIFWREHNRSPWMYAGLAEPLEVFDETPVRIVWSLAPPEREHRAETLEVARPGYIEGQKRLVSHYRAERDPALVRDFKSRLAHWNCELCNFNFAAAYGPIGQRYIEAHHVKPLAEVGETVSTVEDLLAVCANCHRMLHRGWPRLTPDQLRARMAASVD